MFTVEMIGPSLHHIVLNTEEVWLVVAEMSRGRGRGWELHFRAAATALKPKHHEQLRAFGKEQITRTKITERLLK